MRIAVDMSSILWTCLSAGTDTEGTKVEANGRLVQVNTAAYGYEHVVNHLVSMLKIWRLAPKDLIMVFEGMNSKAPRLVINNLYKANRAPRPVEQNLEFDALKTRIQEVFGNLGALSITQDNAEGDDTLGWLAINSEDDLVIDSYDNDLSVLNGTNSYGAKIIVSINGVTGENKYGDFPCSLITVYKSMVGDSKDNISGIKGFGQKAFDTFFAEFGVDGLGEMARLAGRGSLDELVSEMDSNKMIARIVEGRDQFLNSWNLAKLHPEWVDTMRDPLQFKPGLIKGAVNDERLKGWEPTQRLITAVEWESFKANDFDLLLTSEYLALDIETSTPDDSDDWLAAQGKEDGAGVDVMGSELTGMSLTYGDNMQHTVYIPVEHLDTANVPKHDLRDFIKRLCDAGKQLIIQNYSFEGTVLFNEWGSEWMNNGSEGLLPNCLDTKLEASYVDENDSLGLKKLSKKWFNYDQVDYKAVTTIEEVQYKMNELTGQHVMAYGCDDTIVTGSLHNFFKLFMELEHTWKVYLEVEIDAMYLHTQSFIHGTKCDVAKVKELEALDDVTFTESEKVLGAYLVSKGWAGCVAPVVTDEPTPAQVKEIFLIVYGKELETRNRKWDKLIADVESQGGKILASLMQARDWAGINTCITREFKAKPEFNTGSPVQLQRLLYETMQLPVRVYNKPTPIARKQGIRRGSPKTDTLAITYAEKLDATDEQKAVLNALRLMKMVETRRGLYYNTYPHFVHWRTGRIHASHNQASTNTRRASSSAPNLQQLPKNIKIEGQPARFREVIIPHKKNAVVVSMDFVSQEILLLAEWSRDPVLEQVFIGDPPKDMHSMTGVGIYNNQGEGVETLTYEEFVEAVNNQGHPLYKSCKKYRALGKAINFSGQYRVSAAKMATMLMVTEEEAQAMIDAKAEAFPVSEKWAVDEMSNVHETGKVTTLMGAIRHLRAALLSDDYATASKADRQTLSYRIQGSAAEMTKLAEGRMWRERLEQRYDCQIIAPIHDEVAASCAISDLHEFIPAMHRCMVANYAGMRLPIRSSISFGRSFGEQLEIGSEPTAEAIEAGLVELYKSTVKETAICQ